MKYQAALPTRGAFLFDAANAQDGAGIFLPAASAKAAANGKYLEEVLEAAGIDEKEVA